MEFPNSQPSWKLNKWWFFGAPLSVVTIYLSYKLIEFLNSRGFESTKRYNQPGVLICASFFIEWHNIYNFSSFFHRSPHDWLAGARLSLDWTLLFLYCLRLALHHRSFVFFVVTLYRFGLIIVAPPGGRGNGKLEKID